MLATYAEAELPAVAHYYRGLAVAHPFLVARENLLLLFEHNRARYRAPFHSMLLWKGSGCSPQQAWHCMSRVRTYPHLVQGLSDAAVVRMDMQQQAETSWLRFGHSCRILG